MTRLSKPSHVGRTEADIQSDVKMLLAGTSFDLDEPRLEEQLADGTKRRIDVAVGATVIEVKKRLDTEVAAQPYIEQLAGYVRTRMEQEQSRYNGILTDGKAWWLYEVDPSTDVFTRRSVFTLNRAEQGENLIEWLQAVLATQKNRKPTQRAIEVTIGATSPAYEQDAAYLRSLYVSLSDDPTIGLKRELWGRLLRSALGTGFADDDRLFIDHTLLVLEAMAIGHAVMGIPLELAASDVPRFLDGTEFGNAGIHGVMEAGFFDWVLAAGGEGERFISRLIRRIDAFDWSSVEHDVLKLLYESIINAAARKGLGEYYTPDWLAEGIVAKAVTDPLTQKVLDPSCGSGTFIFHAVRRVTAAGDAAGWDNRQIVEHVQGHVFGLDIHPVSIVLARVTFLLALGERLSSDRGDIWVPVHLGDSIQWFQPAGSESDVIRIDTRGNDLTVSEHASSGTLFDLAHVLAFPLSSIDDAGTFDRLVTELTDLARTHVDSTAKKPSPDRVLRKYGIPDGDDAETLRETFRLLADLNAEGRDSIWGFFVRNQVRPLWLSMKARRADVLVGNPPWVSYRYMTASMQAQFRRFSEDRNLWHGRKIATQQDLVALFIVRAAEKYLNDGGTFAFVTPLAVLSRQQYEGFRAGNWGPRLRGSLTELWDLDKVRPKNALFPVPAAVIFGHRNSRELGIDRPDVPHGTTGTKQILSGLRDVSGWEATRENLTLTPAPNQEIGPVDEAGSPYRGSVVNGATIYPRSLFFVTEEATQNRLGMSAGRVSYRSMRSAQEKVPWKDLPDLTGVIDRRFIFDVHLGSTITPFRTLNPWRAILPVERDAVISEEKIPHSDRALTQWWDAANAAWTQNRAAATKLTLWEQLNYQNKLGRQLGAPSQRVVYSKSGTKLAAARITDPHAVIDHKLYWIPARNEGEARYLTAVLNAPVTTETVEVYQSRGLLGARDFDTYVWRLPIPTFDASNGLHSELSVLARRAEDLAAQLDLMDMGFQKARKVVRAALIEAGIQAELNAAVKELFAED
ncbi:N-6 DNA methylase [Brachybacterium sp. J153]|uniref:N-6 DNA methylase n=1 Tax=Brachybacterium sp. J153 TaxID=3116488 RepID=UPI002E767DFC|nr:N-6 DNA methylase [Brachybacterium sp. J153]MEE1619270.1 N-6 DNA methylase [Brachybacterium sp. J153]